MQEVVGRQPELREIARLVDGIAPPPAALVFEGEAGIGKTTLWMAAVDAARKAGVRVLAARCAEQEAILAYAALADLLGDVADDVVSVLPEPQRRALMVALLREEPGESSVDVRSVAAASLGVARALARAGPLMVAVDDVQWIDDASGRVLMFLLRRLDPASPVAVVCSVRTGEGVVDPVGLDAVFGAGCVRHMTVGPLDDRALERILRRAVGDALSGPTLLEIATVVRGNPLFALEVVRATAAATPGHALLAAACISRPTDGLVMGFADVDARAIDVAIEAEVLRSSETRLHFVHPLFATAAYVDAPPEERVAMHRRFAERSADAEERACHLSLTGDPPDERIAAALEEGSTRARARGAPSVAADLALEAVRFTPSEADVDRRRRSIRFADHMYEARFENERAEALLRALLPRCRSASERAGVRWRLARSLIASARNEEADALLAAAMDDVGDDAVLEAAILRHRCWATLGLYRYAGLLGLARAAVRAAERAGEPRGLAASLGWLALAEVVVGDGLHPKMLERAMALWPAHDQPGAAEASLGVDEHPGWSVGWSFLVHDRFDEARTAFDVARQVGRDAGNGDWNSSCSQSSR